MIKRITKRGTATVGELIAALQEFDQSTEVYTFTDCETHMGEQAIEAIETEKDFIYIGSVFALD